MDYFERSAENGRKHNGPRLKDTDVIGKLNFL
ncbi:MAG: hypothetical protein A4E57_04572 [Syntrophorhabdaceae bacterium PtaU1.Bin034]|nr:MAG: hypothetical protein A4E57_04572 [Syntrophorhabdaceae bacterium PtaU1.Bin034]